MQNSTEANAGREEARDVIRSTAPDVVRLDVRMPKANGLDLLEYLEKQQSSPACMMTTQSSAASVWEREDIS
jgi:DNA-binding NarL/FixJ family response regulator